MDIFKPVFIIQNPRDLKTKRKLFEKVPHHKSYEVPYNSSSWFQGIVRFLFRLSLCSKFTINIYFL